MKFIKSSIGSIFLFVISLYTNGSNFFNRANHNIQIKINSDIENSVTANCVGGGGNGLNTAAKT